MSKVHRAVSILRGCAIPCLFVAAMGAGRLLFLYNKLPAIPVPPDREAVAHQWAAVAVPSPQDDFHVYRQSVLSSNAGSSERLADRFRLAGIFVEHGSRADRKAVLENGLENTQIIVRERDVIEKIEIASISRSSVLLRGRDGQEARLTFGFEDPQAGFIAEKSRDIEESADLSDDNFLGSEKIGENSWAFSRESLMAYYAELGREQDRLLNLFDSMAPMRNEDREIEGYMLDIQGEEDFFRSAGLSEGDILRSVNRRPLTGRHIGEAFVADFILGRASAFVVEVERNGEMKQLLYQVR